MRRLHITLAAALALALLADPAHAQTSQKSPPTNWQGSGTTNSTLPGDAFANAVHGTNGFIPGSFTVAQLWALTQTAGQYVYCNNCLIPDGIGSGSIVRSDGTYWRLVGGPYSGIIATTTNIDYCRSVTAHFPNKKINTLWESGAIAFPRSSADYAANDTSGTGAGIALVAATLTNAPEALLALTGSSTTSGYQDVSPLHNAITYKIQNCTFGYFSVDYYITALPTATRSYWSVIGFAVTRGTTTPFAQFVGWLYDVPNQWGYNAGNLNLPQLLVKSGATSTNWTFQTEAPTTSSTSLNTVEGLLELGQVTFYTNGVLQSTVAIGNYYPTNTALNSLLYIGGAISSNAATATINVPRYSFLTRLRAPYSVNGFSTTP